MASEVGICNAALDMLGEPVITSLEDESRTARLCKQRYPKLRDFLLRSFPWKFAAKRSTLAPESETPAFEWDYQFRFPSDLIRFVELYPSSISYKLESNTILCSESVLYIKYIYQVTDPNEMDPAYRESLSTLIARELAIPLANSKTLMRSLSEIYEMKVSDARLIGSMEDDIMIVEAEDWINARL